LESAYRDRRHRLIYLKSGPAWGPIRSDARFASLVAQMGLAQTGMSCAIQGLTAAILGNKLPEIT
jgi:hypothetical protein